MNVTRILMTVLAVTALATIVACSSGGEKAPEMSGRIEAGLRVLTFDSSATDQHFLIYRGDYVRPELPGAGSFTIEIPSLEVTHTVPAADGQRAYFKVPDAGRYEFTLDSARGVIEAIDYVESHYREVSAKEAAGVIAHIDPLILDVRTAGEFAAGHIEGAVLLPVQEIQQRVGDLGDHKKRPVLVYCKSGNRSTVASRVLIGAGFEQVINMRHGVGDWNREGLPLVK